MRHACLLGALSLVAWGTGRQLARPSALSGFAVGAWGRLGGSGRARGACARRAGVNFEDPCEVLGLPPGTNDEAEVKAAARRLSKIYHPDVPITGDVDAFQAVQLAAQQLLEGAPYGLDGSPMDRVYTWGTDVKHTSTYASQHRAPSSAAQTIHQADFAGSRGGRVDVKACASRRRPDLRKTPKLTSITHVASPETVATVQAVLASRLGVPADLVVPDMPLMNLGFVLEHGSVGMQNVADAMMALEEEFGIQLLTILVGTWMKLDMPPSVNTVQDLADFVESKANA